MRADGPAGAVADHDARRPALTETLTETLTLTESVLAEGGRDEPGELGRVPLRGPGGG